MFVTPLSKVYLTAERMAIVFKIQNNHIFIDRIMRCRAVGYNYSIISEDVLIPTDIHVKFRRNLKSGVQNRKLLQSLFTSRAVAMQV